MSTFNFLDKITEIVPKSFNDLFSWEKYTELKDPITSNIPIVGENPLRYTTNAVWHRKIPEKEKKTRRYQMQEAICDNDLKKVKAILDSGFDLNTQICDERGIDSIHLSSILDRSLILKYLILRGGNLEFRDKEGNTPLMSAVKNWQFEGIKILVENGADLGALDKYGKDCVQKARDRNLGSIAGYLDGERKKRERGDFDVDYPKFDVKFKFEGFFDEREGICENFIGIRNGSYYPFNSIGGSYLVDSFEVLGVDGLND